MPRKITLAQTSKPSSPVILSKFYFPLTSNVNKLWCGAFRRCGLCLQEDQSPLALMLRRQGAGQASTESRARRSKTPGRSGAWQGWAVMGVWEQACRGDQEKENKRQRMWCNKVKWSEGLMQVIPARRLSCFRGVRQRRGPWCDRPWWPQWPWVSCSYQWSLTEVHVQRPDGYAILSLML